MSVQSLPKKCVHSLLELYSPPHSSWELGVLRGAGPSGLKSGTSGVMPPPPNVESVGPLRQQMISRVHHLLRKNPPSTSCNSFYRMSPFQLICPLFSKFWTLLGCHICMKKKYVRKALSFFPSVVSQEICFSASICPIALLCHEISCVTEVAGYTNCDMALATMRGFPGKFPIVRSNCDNISYKRPLLTMWVGNFFLVRCGAHFVPLALGHGECFRPAASTCRSIKTNRSGKKFEEYQILKIRWNSLFLPVTGNSS